MSAEPESNVVRVHGLSPEEGVELIQVHNKNVSNESKSSKREGLDEVSRTTERKLVREIGEGPGLGEVIVEAKNIHKTYLLGVEGVPALRGVSVAIQRGEFICILGKSGGGKTSMLNILGTIDKPTKGELRICGKRIRDQTTDEEFAAIRLTKVGFVFQTFNLIASMTALENVSLPMVLEGRRSPSEIRERAASLLESVGMGPREDHLPSQLSGGEQQRVTIARAIANQPDVFLLDEPTGDLDSHNSHIILNLLLKLNREENITLIMVTHDRALKFYAHRCIHMMDGKINYIEDIPARVRREHDVALVAELRDEFAVLAERKRRGERDVVEERPPAMETEIRDVAAYKQQSACVPMPSY